MITPLVTIIIPTYNRPHLLPRAVASALAQTYQDIEVLVVDDGSSNPITLAEDPRLRVLQLFKNQGVSIARNTGAKEAKGRYICYLDDDDQLYPHMVEVSLNALRKSDLPQPVAAISGLESINLEGKVKNTHLPPTLPRGCYFSLEEIEAGKSFISKQTLFIEREVFLSIGGFDESLRSRVYTDLFLRLNPVCSLLGIPVVTYQLSAHEGPRISKDPSLRQKSFNDLMHKHNALFQAHPKMFADFIYNHALTSYQLGQKKEAFF